MAPPQVSGNFLKPNEQEWKEVFNRLSERFPTVKGHQIAQALREHHGHAGEAAAVLRDLTSCSVKEADPDDVEHVATLLSSPAMLKHACKEQFRKFDVNKDGVLEWDEVKQLVNNLYDEFGLQMPSEGSLKAFFFATDENMDGVLSEREFRKFFEMFLRYAFFDHLKLRQMVEKGQEIEQRRNSMNADQIPKVTEVRADADTASPQDSRASSASDGNKPATPDETQAPPKSQTKPERVALAPIDQQKPPRRSPKSEDKQQDRSQQRDRDHRSSRDKERERAPPPEVSEGPFGTAIRCLAQNGVAYRASPDFQDRMDAVVGRGETVRVLEHWIRTPDGWLPVMDPQFQPLFERSSAEPGDGTRNGSDNQRQTHAEKKRVSIQEQRDDTLDVNVRSASAVQKSPKPAEAFGCAAVAPPRVSHEAESGGLKSNEEEWRPVFERLSQRFPGVPECKIAQALRDNDGHAGKAASMLRYM